MCFCLTVLGLRYLPQLVAVGRFEFGLMSCPPGFLNCKSGGESLEFAALLQTRYSLRLSLRLMERFFLRSRTVAGFLIPRLQFLLLVRSFSSAAPEGRDWPAQPFEGGSGSYSFLIFRVLI